MQSEQPIAQKYTSRRRRAEVGVGAAGAITGAAMGGLAAGPPGAVAGALLGAAFGALTGWAASSDLQAKRRHNRELDREIGVEDGSLGAPGLRHPPATLGALSKEAAGAGAEVESEAPPAEGPLLTPPD
jgi:hypothetical protein